MFIQSSKEINSLPFTGALDVFFLGYPSTINKITNSYLDFDKYYKTYPLKTFPPEVAYPELSWQEYIISNGIIPRFYQSYFIIKRAKSQDDIKLYPPSGMKKTIRLLSKYNHWKLRFKSSIKSLAEHFLNIFRKITPVFLRKILYHLLSFLTKVLNFIRDRCL